MNLHHANLLLGASEEAETYFRSFCDNLGITLTNNPDFFAFRMSTFGIDEARQLQLLAARKSVTHLKIFFISPRYLTFEAQNALLKTFEDPFPSTYFFLVAREEALIRPTLLSRMQTIRMSEGQTVKSTDAEKFLSLSLQNRLLFAKKFIEEEKNLLAFLDDLLLLLRAQKNQHDLVESVYNIRRVARDPIAAPRLIIEHLSLVL